MNAGRKPLRTTSHTDPPYEFWFRIQKTGLKDRRTTPKSFKEIGWGDPEYSRHLRGVTLGEPSIGIDDEREFYVDNAHAHAWQDRGEITNLGIRDGCQRPTSEHETGRSAL